MAEKRAGWRGASRSKPRSCSLSRKDCILSAGSARTASFATAAGDRFKRGFVRGHDLSRRARLRCFFGLPASSITRPAYRSRVRLRGALERQQNRRANGHDGPSGLHQGEALAQQQDGQHNRQQRKSEISEITIDALPPDSRARKLVHAPRPFRVPPAIEHPITRAPKCAWGRAKAITVAESATIAQQNQRNERSLEMRLVESFCVTPVMPHSTSATTDSTNQRCILLPPQALSR